MPALRLDKLLWYLRLIKTRSQAQALVLAGHVRIDGRRVERAHVAVRPGMVVTLPWGQGARVLTILQLPDRRGPAPEARACYRDHDAVGDERGAERAGDPTDDAPPP